MDSQKIIAWLESNKNLDNTVDRFFDERTRVAIFMAGIPGAGKTELVRRMSHHLLGGIVVIEHDKLVELLPDYKPEAAYNYRPAGSKLVSAILKQVLKRKMSFLVDTTLSARVGQTNIKQALKHGYHVTVICIHQDPQAAWQLTQKREVVTKRGISWDGFESVCQKINGNLSDIFDKHSTNPNFSFVYVDKTKHQQMGLFARLLPSCLRQVFGLPNNKARPLTIIYDQHNQKTTPQIKQLLAQAHNLDELRQ